MPRSERYHCPQGHSITEHQATTNSCQYCRANNARATRGARRKHRLVLEVTFDQPLTLRRAMTEVSFKIGELKQFADKVSIKDYRKVRARW